jgi:hypothetical protein
LSSGIEPSLQTRHGERRAVSHESICASKRKSGANLRFRMGEKDASTNDMFVVESAIVTDLEPPARRLPNPVSGHDWRMSATSARALSPSVNSLYDLTQ